MHGNWASCFFLCNSSNRKSFLLQLRNNAVTCTGFDNARFRNRSLHIRTIVAVQVHSLCNFCYHIFCNNICVNSCKEGSIRAIIAAFLETSRHYNISFSLVCLCNFQHFRNISSAADRIHANHGSSTGIQETSKFFFCSLYIIHKKSWVQLNLRTPASNQMIMGICSTNLVCRYISKNGSDYLHVFLHSI